MNFGMENLPQNNEKMQRKHHGVYMCGYFIPMWLLCLIVLVLLVLIADYYGMLHMGIMRPVEKISINMPRSMPVTSDSIGTMTKRIIGTQPLSASYR
jgi:hypothetical protein